MKIRMKHNRAVVEEVTGDGDGRFGYCYTRKDSRDGQWSVFTKEEWEPVPEERWRDVTGEWTDLNGVSHYRDAIFCQLVDGNGCIQPGYKLRKVPVSFTGPGVEFGCQKGYAFIIEKREG